MKPRQLERYAALCGWALARAHARTGRAPMIAGYLGNSDRFDRAIERFSLAYADQNEDDHQRRCTRGRRRHAPEPRRGLTPSRRNSFE